MSQGQGSYQGVPLRQGSPSLHSTPQQRQGEPPSIWAGHEQQPGPQQPMLPKPGQHPQPVVMFPVMYHQLPNPNVPPHTGAIPGAWPQFVPPHQPYPPQAQFVYPTPALQYSYQPHYADYSQYQGHPLTQPQPQAERSTPVARPFNVAFGDSNEHHHHQRQPSGTQLPSLASATQQAQHQQMLQGIQQQQQQQQQQQHPESHDPEALRAATASAMLTARLPVPPYAIATTNNASNSITVNNPVTTPTATAASSVSSTSTAINVNSPSTSANKKSKTETPTPEGNAAKKGFRNSRRRHRNSHLGCATCKSRRIKCDEQLPECRNCIRARLTCAYLALDDTAREALKVAQQAHAARIQSLNYQAREREAHKAAALQTPAPQFPYEAQGLPSKIFMNQLPPFPPSNAQPIEINLQRAELPVHRLQSTLSYATSTHSTPPSVMTGLPSSTSEEAPNSASSSTVEPKFSIKSDSYASLAALLRHHKDVDPQADLDQLPQLDGEFTEIILDPDCLMSLNKYWPGFDKKLLIPFEVGFENESLYVEYDLFHKDEMREAPNNIVLFKSILSSGAALVHQKSQNPNAKEVAKKYLDRDLEITLRYLNKFRMSFSKETKDIKSVYLNVSLSFSTFQTYQSSYLTTFYGSLSLKDNFEFLNRFFDFLSKYISNEFCIFLRDDIPPDISDSTLFKRADLLNSYIHVFIIYYVQCIKAIHTKPYNTVFMNEFLIKLKAIRPYVYNKVGNEDRAHYNNLVEFITHSCDYWDEVRDGNISTNRIQVIFYSLKKFLSLIPENSFVGSGDFSFEQDLIYAYYHAAIGALKAIYSETRFFFLFSFNGRDGTRTANPIVDAYEAKRVTDAQKDLLKYPVTVIKYFKERSMTFSQYLKNVSKFPAKIMLDDTNKQILTNLVQEVQLESFNSDIKVENYPHIDSTSNFYDDATKSIVIPSVSTTNSFSNFDIAQQKRSRLMKSAIDLELSDTDKRLISSLFDISEAPVVQKQE